MTQRCGSFPLLNLAHDYGVDYGDVLLAVMGYRAMIGDASCALSPARWQEATRALDRLDRAIQHQQEPLAGKIDAWAAFGRAIMDHASARWAR